MNILSEQVLQTNSPLANSIPSFLLQHVFPELNSSHGFLRAKACECVVKYGAALGEISESMEAFGVVIALLADLELPVRVSAALALTPFLKDDSSNLIFDLVCEAMRPHVVKVMKSLMETMDEIEVDMISTVMEVIVFEFSKEVAPFAVEMSNQLVFGLLMVEWQFYEVNGGRG